jgi:hypothetical protein
MLRKLRPHLTYANVASSLALFLALGGVSYAAVTLPKNSVGSRQLKKNAVTASKIKNGSLGLGEFKNGALRKGIEGPQGEQGPQGDQGPSGVSGAHVVKGADTTIAAVGGYGTATVTCPDGERVLSGNYEQIDGVPSITVYRSRISDDGTSYSADGQNVSMSTGRRFYAWAVCAK